MWKEYNLMGAEGIKWYPAATDNEISVEDNGFSWLSPFHNDKNHNNDTKQLKQKWKTKQFLLLFTQNQSDNYAVSYIKCWRNSDWDRESEQWRVSIAYDVHRTIYYFLTFRKNGCVLCMLKY